MRRPHLVDVAVFCDSDDTHIAQHQLLRLCPSRTTVRVPAAKRVVEDGNEQLCDR